MRRSLQEQNAKEDRDKKHKETPHKHKKKPSQQEGEANKTKQDRRQRGGQNQTRKKRGAGEESQRRPAERREDVREGSRGREKTAQAKKADGDLRGFWITQGRILPQCRCERPLNKTHMMERAKHMHPAQETKSSTKQLLPTDPILGPETLLKTGFAQKSLPSVPGVCTYENTAHRRCHQKSAHSEMSCAQTLTSFVLGLYNAEGRGTKHCKQKRQVKNR